jgi:hypothetical protein
LRQKITGGIFIPSGSSESGLFWCLRRETNRHAVSMKLPSIQPCNSSQHSRSHHDLRPPRRFLTQPPPDSTPLIALSPRASPADHPCRPCPPALPSQGRGGSGRWGWGSACASYHAHLQAYSPKPGTRPPPCPPQGVCALGTQDEPHQGHRLCASRISLASAFAEQACPALWYSLCGHDRSLTLEISAR